MKLSISIFVAVIATSVSAGSHGWSRPQNLDKIPRDKPLPLHQMPECWQGCFQSTNHAYGGGDFNTINQHDFCEDKWGHFRSWSKTWGHTCGMIECKDKEDGYRMVRWFNSVCLI
ncbi:hypothetical protein CGCSCA4_v003251 [Colletotrichum siamense]|uniref:Uncharacterized protein n=1 Tax=Colletotrichum siamense TaxID=690259 RepID=A0A9P5ETD9_COLSI|nr:hypothetical protein CGCSCA4_v003251 [Colletotrichum siamense]KAF4859319.1 hypothetical protein CGCSCA2_v006363 [Colletotrichum siamense]